MPAGVEIERKFLVETPPGDLNAHPSDEIDQGYLAITDDGVEVRLRRYGSQASLTIKSGGGRARVEEEFEIDERRFTALWALTDGRRVQKTRYRIQAGGGLTIELDVYRGALEGLMTAEVEFESAGAAAEFDPPPWLGREVTDDQAYKNKRLAVDGLPAERR
jgi:adenylate cyclase